MTKWTIDFWGTIAAAAGLVYVSFAGLGRLRQLRLRRRSRSQDRRKFILEASAEIDWLVAEDAGTN